MTISLRQVRVHNLKGIDLDLPYNQLIVFCGLSGCGKSSLALDTLYAEGQRRYIESFSASARHFLEKLEKPDAGRLDGIPAAVAVTAQPHLAHSRANVGTATETLDYLRLLFAKIGAIRCSTCGREVKRHTPESILSDYKNYCAAQQDVTENMRAMIGFVPPQAMRFSTRDEFCAAAVKNGFVRGVWKEKPFRCDDDSLSAAMYREILAAWKVGEEEIVASEIIPNELRENETENSLGEVTENIETDDFSDDVATLRRVESRAENDEEETESEEPVSEIPAIFQTRFYDGDEEIESPQTNNKNVNSRDAHSTCAHSTNSPPPLLLIVDRIVVGIPKMVENSSLGNPAAQRGGDMRSGEASSPTRLGYKTEESQILHSLEVALDNGDDAVYIVQENFARGYSRNLRCEDCKIDFTPLQPQLFSFTSPLGACLKCEGFGTLLVYDLALIAPHRNKLNTVENSSLGSPAVQRGGGMVEGEASYPTRFGYKSLADGAIVTWGTPAFKSTNDEMLTAAEKLGLNLQQPLAEWTRQEWQLFLFGTEKISGLAAMFQKLQRQKYKMSMRVFLSRWRSHRPCPQCRGARLREEALAVRIAGDSLADWTSMKISALAEKLRSVAWTTWEEQVGRLVRTQVLARLDYLIRVGLGYLTLDRSVRSLSGGEQRRVALTSILGSSLVNLLYVFDEPTMGLHPTDTARLMESVASLRDRGNTVIVVDHNEEVFRAADHIVELGPEAGERGGQIVFQGSLKEMLASPTSYTGSYLSGARSTGIPPKRRSVHQGMIELFGASGHNLQNINVAFPLGMLCVVTGVSGAGKTSLVQGTLYPAIHRALHRESFLRGLPFQDVQGTSQIDEVVMITQTPIGRSLRSNPVTYLKIFDEIRQVFAGTLKARTKNYSAGYFSFNVDGGRCNTCKGEGFIAIDMQFMADMYIRCPTCHGTRYQREILEVTYRDKTIADVLAMTAREAFGFFRGQAKVQQKLKLLLDVGLDYLQLGQPANTLSGGESQRLKLAAYLSQTRRGRTLFLMDEPTNGLHFGDVVQLLDCFDALIETGHSLIVVEHHLQMMQAADWLIDLGHGAAENGGRVVAEGTPEDLAATPVSPTGSALASALLFSLSDTNNLPPI